jgi:hypothetical protein
MGEPAEAKSQDGTELTANYANNVYYEPTVWDLKLIFGEFSGKSNAVDWHTSITIPWAQAKLLFYYLAINIAFQEIQQGPIHVASAVLPPVPPEPTDAEKNSHFAGAMHEFALKMHQKFIDGLGKPPAV